MEVTKNKTGKEVPLITVVVGTRPEAIKLAPVVIGLSKARGVHCRLCTTGQHREMVGHTLADFGLKPDHDLGLMRPGQTLAELTARSVEGLDKYLMETRPDLVVTQGDTTTVLCAALAAFYQRIPVAHVEAGLRTGNLQAPWPEEANRTLTARLADLHFAPTAEARANLLREGIPESKVHVTGNTVVDALFLALESIKGKVMQVEGLPAFLQPSPRAPVGVVPGDGLPGAPRYVLITGHRRENFGPGFESICRAISELAKRFPETHFVYPVHLNPCVQEPVRRILSEHGRNVHLVPPVPYLTFIALMQGATLILTDSGGVQEEAPSLGKPVLVMRDTTERPEAVAAGTVALVGADAERIVGGVSQLLLDSARYAEMARAHNPYGDGKASGRIIDICLRYLGVSPDGGATSPAKAAVRG